VDAWRRSLALARMQVRVPTLFMVGEEDGCIAPSAFADAPRYVDARSAVCCIPGAGHFVTVEAPDAMAREILGFVAAEEPGHG
jgi:pimeloyl-ACP methyl ester carboxylesterase